MIIEVKPRIKDYVPYDYWLLGASIRGIAVEDQTAITPEQRLAYAWVSTMRRCYDTTDISYPMYGGKGVSVCKRWQTVANYIEDVQKLHGWSRKLADWSGYQLDKDYYGSQQYGPETCVWLSKAENATLSGQPIYINGAFGVRVLYLSCAEAGKALGICHKLVHLHAKLGRPLKYGRHQGYKFEYALDAGHLRHPLTGEQS